MGGVFIGPNPIWIWSSKLSIPEIPGSGGCTSWLERLHRLAELEDWASRRCHLLSGAVAPPARARRPSSSGCTSWQSSKTELKRCHLLSGEVAPPSLARRLSPGGATSWLGRLHRPVSLGDLAWAVAPPCLGGCTSHSFLGSNGLNHSTQLEFFRGPIAPGLS